MKKIFTLLVGLVAITSMNAQVSVCLGTDATVCQGQPVTITDCGSGSGGGGLNLNNPGSVSLGDDVWSGVIPMGFTFNFYGSNFSNCIIGSNGLVSFNTGQANGYCPWSLNSSQTLPNTTLSQCFNAAMLCYGDLYPTGSTSGPIQYQTLGTAPNRKFVVLYNSVTMYSCTSQCVYAGIVFYETSNIVEMFIGSKTVCSTWNGGVAVQGTENSSGSVAHITPGRNMTVWTATSDGKRWTPTSPSNTNSYTISTIPYTAITAPGGATQWHSTLNQNFPYNGGVLTINTPPPGTTGYYLTGSSCGVATGAVSDTTWITRVSVAGNATATTDYCNGGSGTATANVTSTTGGPFTFLWSPGGQTTQTATNLVAGPYTCTITNAAGCTANVNVTVPNALATFNGSTTQVTCPGGSDGTATASTTAAGTISYSWDDPANQTTATATGLAAGVYNCTVTSTNGCSDVVTVTVTEIPGMNVIIAGQTDVSCNSGSDGMAALQVTGGTPNYSYVWAGSSSTAQAANDLNVGPHLVTITDQNGCVVTTTVTMNEPAPLAITSITPDMFLCPESSTTLSATGTGGSTAYTYTWTENGTTIGTGQSITVDPSANVTQYCVTLSEQCGSPTDNECMTITFPAAVEPLFAPNVTTQCVPGDFTFINNSTNQASIATMNVEFGDGTSELYTGPTGFDHQYPNSGIYDMTVTVTSVDGCITVGNFPGIVQVVDNPVASFAFSANPTTFYETTVVGQDQSTPGVVSWTWSAPGATPSSSTQENPTFTFPEGVVGNYPVQLVVVSEVGCIDTVEFTLQVVSDIIFYAPNTFTPDGDEFNQTWGFFVDGIDEFDFELLVFNRWGEIIWETHDVNAKWDGTYHGKVAPQGSYNWIARVKNKYDDSKEEFRGSMSIQR
jgi:gliding motility-associated-like protein